MQQAPLSLPSTMRSYLELGHVGLIDPELLKLTNVYEGGLLLKGVGRGTNGMWEQGGRMWEQAQRFTDSVVPPLSPLAHWAQDAWQQARRFTESVVPPPWLLSPFPPSHTGPP